MNLSEIWMIKQPNWAVRAEVFAGKGASGGARAQCNHQWESWRVMGQPCACFVIF
jgi:hypothetical protein